MPSVDGPTERSSTTGAAPAPAAAPDPRFSLDDPASPWVVVNKQRPLAPAGHTPADLVQPNVQLAVPGEVALLNNATASAVETMFIAAAHDGVTMTLASGYRSYITQADTYSGHVATLGQESADDASAKPGHSEHQTGWALDIGDDGACNFQPCFADRPAAQWAAANAHRFGFIIRYPVGARAITGYAYEPWHLHGHPRRQHA
ncbi:M15 family metallopeptidase [Pseudarthrobacter sp. MDT3-1]